MPVESEEPVANENESQDLTNDQPTQVHRPVGGDQPEPAQTGRPVDVPAGRTDANQFADRRPGGPWGDASDNREDERSSAVNIGGGLYRDEPAAETRPMPAQGEDPEEARAQQRAANRAERNRALGKVDRPRPEPPTTTAPIVAVPTTDRLAGSLGLFLLRLITAGIMFVHGVQHLVNMTATQNFIDSSTVLPEPQIMAWVLGVGEILIGVALLFGFLTRVAGFFLAVLGGMALGFVMWGSVNPFQADTPGFTGELELLLLGVGLLFLFVGSGRWAIDGAMRTRRRIRKEESLGSVGERA